MIATAYSLGVTLITLSLIPPLGGTDTSPKQSDLGRMRGRWTACAGARHEVRVILEIEGRRATASIKTPSGVRLLLEGEVKLDETTSPRRLDWVKFTGADQQEFPPLLAIYTIDGDRFTVCNGGLNGSRPTEFKRGDGILAEVVVFQREPMAVARKSKTTVKPDDTAKR